jgi:hypothetical protein
LLPAATAVGGHAGWGAWGRREGERELRPRGGENEEREGNIGVCSPEGTKFSGASIDSEPEVGSMNRKHRDEALDETNEAVLSNFANDAQIENNCSLELEPPRTSSSNSGNCGSNLGKQFRYLERVRCEGSSHIYIYIARVLRYFVFCNKFVFKIKIISKMDEIIFNVRKYIKRLQKF